MLINVVHAELCAVVGFIHVVGDESSINKWVELLSGTMVQLLYVQKESLGDYNIMYVTIFVEILAGN